MAEQLKAIYNLNFLDEFGQVIKKAYSPFLVNQFIDDCIDEEWEETALKARMRKITVALKQQLPENYKEAISILLVVNRSCFGFPYLVLPDYVEQFGLDEWDISMHALEQFTSHSSAEFAVRPFFLIDSKRMLNQMLKWAESPDEHVRRLASEGCRPALPWGQALKEFKRDPTPLLFVLDKLKQDSSLYVRKSVANNLNDIAKTHPALVIQTAQAWQGKHAYTDWIIRHGCRTLIRQAHPEVLQLFGYTEVTEAQLLVEMAKVEVMPSTINIGENTQLSYSIRIRQGQAVKLRIEYGIAFIKATGKQSIKKFLLSDKTVAGGTTLAASRTHKWADLTTRKHYPGTHKIVLFVNGLAVAETTIELVKT